MSRPASRPRRAGLLIPLFSIASSKSWGIGEFADLPRLGAWLRQAGQRVLLMLPLNEMPLAETSPYSALSAMALDPQFIALDAVDDFKALGGEASLEPELHTRLDAARRASSIDYANVRDLKQIVLRRSFARFLDVEWRAGTSRATALRAFIETQAWWLDDYALFRALQGRHGARVWHDWPEPIRMRHADAIERARGELAEEMLYRQYVQWIAGEQWAAARAAARDIAVFGDLPFAVGAETARRIQRDRAGLAAAGVSMGRAGRPRLQAAARSRDALRQPVRRLPRRPPGRVLPHVYAADRWWKRGVHASGPARAAGAR
jgi:4-alpha-glucanotransferase